MLESVLLMCVFCTLLAVSAAAYCAVSAANVLRRFANTLEAEAVKVSQSVRSTMGPLREAIDEFGKAKAEPMGESEGIDFEDEEELRQWMAK